MNAELKTASDAPADVARHLVHAIERGTARMQIGWPEKLFARLNGLLPGLVDRSLRSRLPAVRKHARRSPLSTTEHVPHEAHPR